MSTKFDVDSSSRFSFRGRTHTHTDRQTQSQTLLLTRYPRVGMCSYMNWWTYWDWSLGPDHPRVRNWFCWQILPTRISSALRDTVSIWRGLFSCSTGALIQSRVGGATPREPVVMGLRRARPRDRRLNAFPPSTVSVSISWRKNPRHLHGTAKTKQS